MTVLMMVEPLHARSGMTVLDDGGPLHARSGMTVLMMVDHSMLEVE